MDTNDPHPVRADAPTVALVRPPVIFKNRGLANEATPALGLAYISGYILKFGFNPVLIDGMGEGLNNIWAPDGYPDYACQGLTFDDIVSRIPDDAAVIGVAAMFSGEWPIVRELIQDIRRRFPEALIVAGGEHLTALPEYCLRDCPALDLCVLGEGERTFKNVLDARLAGEPFDGIDGVAFIDAEGNFVRSSGSPPRIREIDEIPWPHWPEGYMERFWSSGKSFGPQSARDMPMMFSRGCPYRCTFCSNEGMWTTRYVLRDIEDVVAETKHYVEKYDITAVQLYDLTAITKKRWIVGLLTRLLEEGVQVQWDFPSGTRSEILDGETLALLKKAGTNYLCMAPESGSPRTLKLIQKKIDLGKMTQAMRTAKGLGMTVRANTIIGFPGEKRSDIYKTLFYGLRLIVMGVDELQPYIFMPYPGSTIFKGLVAEGALEVSDDYFLALSGLNSDLLSFNPLTFNKNVGAVELAFYRLVFTMLSYGLSYLLHPSRIVRTIRNLVTHEDAATVFEHRLKDIFRRRKGS